MLNIGSPTAVLLVKIIKLVERRGTLEKQQLTLIAAIQLHSNNSSTLLYLIASITQILSLPINHPNSTLSLSSTANQSAQVPARSVIWLFRYVAVTFDYLPPQREQNLRLRLVVGARHGAWGWLVSFRTAARAVGSDEKGF